VQKDCLSFCILLNNSAVLRGQRGFVEVNRKRATEQARSSGRSMFWWAWRAWRREKKVTEHQCDSPSLGNVAASDRGRYFACEKCRKHVRTDEESGEGWRACDSGECGKEGCIAAGRTGFDSDRDHILSLIIHKMLNCGPLQGITVLNTVDMALIAGGLGA
jgi:hypothetical protein